MNSEAEQATDVVVIGGGLAGLAAAAYVARAGRSVAVLERSGHVGGRAITNDLEGFRFNLGPHALYDRGPAGRVLKELGVPYTGKKPLLRGRLLLEGALHTVSMNPWHFATTKLLSAAGKLALGPAVVSVLRTDPASVRHLSVSAWLEGLTRHADVRRFIEAFIRVTSYGNDPARMSAEVAVTQLKLAVRGVRYLDGGWQTLVNGLRRVAEAAGARIVTSAKVAAIEREAGAVRRVRLDDGSSFAAVAVILANGPRAAADLAGDPELRDRTDQATSVRAACLDLGLSRLPRPNALFSLGVDTPLYFSVHSAAARLAPDGGAMIHVAKYLPPEEADAKAVERELEEFVDLVQPGWRDVLAKRRFLPALEVVSALATAEGGGLAGRPGPQVPGTANLFLAGDWVGPEGWLSDASLASARRTASLALDAIAGAAGAPSREAVAATA